MEDVNMRNSVKFVEDNAGIKRYQENEYVHNWGRGLMTSHF